MHHSFKDQGLDHYTHEEPALTSRNQLLVDGSDAKNGILDLLLFHYRFRGGRNINYMLIFECSVNGMLRPTAQRILQLQAGICKILSNPKRLQIMHELRSGEKTVGELTTLTGMRQANVSQHLALMRLVNMVLERRVGNTVFYRISDTRITEACDIMRSVLLDQAAADSKLMRSVAVSSR